MVFSGKPSKDCQPCRKRKLRCDLRKGSCGQCKRAGISCFGYRDLKDLIFRDQTRQIQQKVAINQEKPVLQNQGIGTLVPYGAHSLPPQAPQLAWSIRARHDFFSHYDFDLSNSYDVLITLFSKARSEDHLEYSLNAVSLAFFASTHHDAPSTLLHLAGKHYTIALQRLNYALQSRDVATSDNCLQTVLLLDLYEKLAGRDLGLSASWTGHIFGGLALVHIRGHQDIVRNHVGRQLGNILYVKSLISCIIAAKRVPESLNALGRSLDPFHEKDDAKWVMTRLNEQILNFRMNVLEGRYGCHDDVVAEAMRIDSLYRDITRSLSQRWFPTRVPTCKAGVSSNLVFEDHYDIYEDHYVTQVRNVLRTMHLHLYRIALAHPLQDSLDGGLHAFAESLQTSIENYAHEICASAPQFLLAEGRPGNTIPFTSIQTMQCRMLLAPLYLAGSSSINPLLRRWVINLMRYMADMGAVEAAQKTADVLEFRPEMEFWDVYAMLGGYAFAA